MARIIYAARALADLERVTEFLLETEPVAASETVGLITTAIETLENHPLIGHAYSPDIRELVISRGRTGYVALYRFMPALVTWLPFFRYGGISVRVGIRSMSQRVESQTLRDNEDVAT